MKVENRATKFVKLRMLQRFLNLVYGGILVSRNEKWETVTDRQKRICRRCHIMANNETYGTFFVYIITFKVQPLFNKLWLHIISKSLFVLFLNITIHIIPWAYYQGIIALLLLNIVHCQRSPQPARREAPPHLSLSGSQTGWAPGPASPPSPHTASASSCWAKSAGDPKPLERRQE